MRWALTNVFLLSSATCIAFISVYLSLSLSHTLMAMVRDHLAGCSILTALSALARWHNGISDKRQRLAHFPHRQCRLIVFPLSGCRHLNVLFLLFSFWHYPGQFFIHIKLRHICDRLQVEPRQSNLSWVFLFRLPVVPRNSSNGSFRLLATHGQYARMSNICHTHSHTLWSSSSVQHMANTWAPWPMPKNKRSKTQILTSFKLKYEQPLRGYSAPRRTAKNTHARTHTHSHTLTHTLAPLL